MIEVRAQRYDEINHLRVNGDLCGLDAARVVTDALEGLVASDVAVLDLVGVDVLDRQSAETLRATVIRRHDLVLAFAARDLAIRGELVVNDLHHLVPLYSDDDQAHEALRVACGF